MNNSLIKNYANKLEKQDIIAFFKKENVNITKNELDIIYNIIKNDIDIILSNDDFYKYIEKYKNNLSTNVYKFIIEKYEKYKGFID